MARNAVHHRRLTSVGCLRFCTCHMLCIYTRYGSLSHPKTDVRKRAVKGQWQSLAQLSPNYRRIIMVSWKKIATEEQAILAHEMPHPTSCTCKCTAATRRRCTCAATSSGECTCSGGEQQPCTGTAAPCTTILGVGKSGLESHLSHANVVVLPHTVEVIVDAIVSCLPAE